MKLHYYEETDSLYIDLIDRPGTETVEVRSGVVLDFGSNGELVGIDVDQASRNLDLKSLHLVALPRGMEVVTG
jgi:uncharacterized protein YuzE